MIIYNEKKSKNLKIKRKNEWNEFKPPLNIS